MEPIHWPDALALIAKHINGMDNPNQIELYTSGRASNEASYLYQLFGRMLGTSNFPDCSNMCHEASGVGLKQSIGVGKGTIRIDDFEKADAIFVFGQNPGTNHPRMLHSLKNAARRGARIVSFNTLRERGLERFADPQDPVQMLTPKSSPISSSYYQPNLGGDMAAVRGMVKALLETHRQRLASGEPALFDLAFIERHSVGVEAYLAQVDATEWQTITAQSGLSEAQLRQAAATYQGAERVICTWAMGVTQHKHSIATVREITNLQLLFGQLGKPGAGLCPVRGHSNVQGNRTMGIDEKSPKALLDSLERHFNFTANRALGHNTVEAIEAMLRGEVKVLIALGGNLAAAAPDTERTARALRNCDLTVHISTKLNRSHLVTGKDALILPTLGRTELDMQSQRLAVHYGRGFVQHGPRLGRHRQAAGGDPTFGDGDRLRHRRRGAGHPAAGLAGIGRRLFADPRSHRRHHTRLRRFQPALRPARRFLPRQCRRRTALRHAERQGGIQRRRAADHPVPTAGQRESTIHPCKRCARTISTTPPSMVWMTATAAFTVSVKCCSSIRRIWRRWACRTANG